MFSSILAFFAALLVGAMASEAHFPRETGPAGVGFDPRGWTPKATPAPNIKPYRHILKRALTNTCAWVEDDPLVCPPNQYCAYNTPLGYMGCCSVYDNGQFVEPCLYQTECINTVESSSLCAAVTAGFCFDSSTAVCGVSTYYPTNSACLTVVLSAGGNFYSMYRCGTSPNYLAATFRDNTISSPFSPSTGPKTTSDIVTDPLSFRSTSSSTSVFLNPTTPSTIIQDDGGSKSNTGAIVGGVVGGVCGALLIGAIIGFIVYRVKKKRREAEYIDDAPEMSGVEYVSR